MDLPKIWINKMVYCLYIKYSMHVSRKVTPYVCVTCAGYCTYELHAQMLYLSYANNNNKNNNNNNNKNNNNNFIKT